MSITTILSKIINIDNFRLIAQLMSIGTLAHGVTLLSTIVVAWLYTPQAIGVYAAWFGIASILSVFSTGRIDNAFFSADIKASSRHLFQTSLALILFFSFLIVLCLFVFYSSLPLFLYEFGRELILCVLLLSLYRLLSNTLTYMGKLFHLGVGRVLYSLFVGFTQIVFTFIEPSVDFLIYGQIFGLAIVCALMLLWAGVSWFKGMSDVRKVHIVAVFKSTARFPLFALPADLCSVAASQLPVILLLAFFDAEVAGVYAIAIRFLNAPGNLAANAILDFFKNNASREYRRFGNCRNAYLSMFRFLSLLGAVPFFAIWLYGAEIITKLFGINWLYMELLVRCLSPVLYLGFVASPLSYVTYICNKPQLDLIWQIILLIIVVCSFSISSRIDDAFVFYAIGYGLMYCVYLVLSYYCACGRELSKYT